MSGSEERPRTDYIVLFQGRAGSSYLMDSLGRVPGVVAEGEMLVGVGRPKGTLPKRLRWLIRHGANWILHPSTADDAAALQLRTVRHFYGARWEGARAVGFKTKLRDVYDLDALGQLLAELGVRVVVLERPNLVKQAVSHLNAARLYAARHEWNLSDERARLGPFEIAPEVFDETLRQIVFAQDMVDAFCRYLQAPTLRLKYADLLRDPAAWFGSVCRFVGMPPTEPTSTLSKSSDDDLSRLLLNFGDLRARYEGTPYAPMFDENAD